MKGRKILVTGGSGLLGSELKKLLPDAVFPSHEEFDVTRPEHCRHFCEALGIEQILHAAAVISPPLIEQVPRLALEANILGTAFLTHICFLLGIRMIYVSTDYVFNGKLGLYSEDDSVHPVNKYAWSKLGGECAVRMLDDSLIVRASFGPEIFPYDKAVVDQWTSREPVGIIAKKIVQLLDFSDLKGVIHLGGRRQTVYEYARPLAKGRELGELRRAEMGVEVPRDTSLSTAKYAELTKEIE